MCCSGCSVVTVVWYGIVGVVWLAHISLVWGFSVVHCGALQCIDLWCNLFVTVSGQGTDGRTLN